MGESRPRVLWAVVAGVLLVILAGLALRASGQRTNVIVSNGVPQAMGVVRLSKPSALTCERGVVLPAPARIFRVWGTGVGSPNPPFELVVRDLATRATLARGLARPAPEGLRSFAVTVGRDVPSSRPVDVCIRTRGRGDLDLYGLGGGPGSVTPPQEELVFRGVGPLAGDFRVDVLRASPTSLLERMPGALRKAATFKPLGVGAWTFWLVIVLTIGLVPVAVARMLAWAVAEDAAAASAPERHAARDRSDR